jgi:NAD(P)-dependent dehydrogenase (short-subunit alcohol dehydrogenase family)
MAEGWGPILEPNAKSVQGKVGLATGATNGIGLVAARELARRGAPVVLVGRSPARCDSAVAQVPAQTGDPQPKALRADLSSQQQQVRDLAERFRDRHSRLDVLVNHAGGMWLRRETTEDGLGMTVAVIHLAYFLLTRLLLDALKASAPARVVNVASAALRKATLGFNNLCGQPSPLAPRCAGSCYGLGVIDTPHPFPVQVHQAPDCPWAMLTRL